MADEITVEQSQASTIAELETDPAGIVKRWNMELEEADREEQDWRKEGENVFDTYEAVDGENQAKFNILWSNTETLQPAVYNSTPDPDVRRRFRDKDVLGKHASTIMERALSYQIDNDDYETTIEDVVLDVLLPGRGLARIKYVPTTAPMEGGVEVEQDVAGEGEPDEEIIDESAPVEHVQWNDFRRGRAKRWSLVPWVAFRHDMTRDDLTDSFGEDVAKLVPLTESESRDKDDDDSKEARKVFRTAEVWEIWDKDQRRVLFICRAYKERPLNIVSDPLGLPGFFPNPRPVYAVRSSRSLLPIPPFRQYKKQAKELDDLTIRINKIVGALRVRGAYNAVSDDIQKIMNAGDLEMIPIQAVAETAQAGGLDKQIWLMPVDMLAKTLRELYAAREQTKQTIYEISGVSDIIRGSTDPDETATAQSLKSKWGSLRLDKLKRDVQRFVRDLMRLQADVIASKFQPETLAQITQISLPSAEDKQQIQTRMQQAQAIQNIPDPAAQQVAMQQLPPMPENAEEVMQQPTWDEVMAVLRDDLSRSYKIDIETDSTVAETIDRDLQGMREVITAIGELIGGSMPAVQSGVLPMEAVKDIALSMARHARLGRSVEDAIEQIQAPPPPPPPGVEGPDPAIQQAVQDIMAAIKAPKKIVAQADPDGRVEGDIVEEAA